MRLLKYITVIQFFIQINIFFAQTKDIEFEHLTTADGLVTNWMIPAAIEQDSQGFIWIGSDHGLHKYDGYNFTVYTNDKNDSTSISNNSIRVIHKDSKDRLWIGTSSGLNLWQPKTETFKQYFITDSTNPSSNVVYLISWDNEGNLIIGVDDIIRKFNPTTEIFETDYEDSYLINELSNNNVLIGYLDKNDIIWLGTKDGIIKYDHAASEIKHYNLSETKFDINSKVIISSIAEDLSGRLLLGGKNSLYYFDREKEKAESLQNLSTNSIPIWAPKGNGNESVFYAGWVSTIYQSRITKEYWISTSNTGANRFDSTGNLIQHQSREFSSLFEDKSGTIWQGTDANGIFKTVSPAANFKPKTYGLDELKILEGQHVLGYWRIILEIYGLVHTKNDYTSIIMQQKN